jgi:Carboxypeptidase regulatory-like domain
MNIKSFNICLVILLVSLVAAWASEPAGPARIQGLVKDSASKPIAGAEVHISAKDGSGLEKVVRTDFDGHYGVSKLPVTGYRVVLFVNGQIKASINNTNVFSDKPTQLDFALTGKMAANTPKKYTHMVYVPAETGSHLGGHWVEVDDAPGSSTAATQTNRIDHASGAALRQLTGRTNPVGIELSN